MKNKGRQQHTCVTVPLLFEDDMTARMGCVKCEVNAMKPSVLQWCDAAIRLNVPDDVATDVAFRMRPFYVHPVWLALSKKEVRDPILVMCDDMAVARMGLFGYKKTHVVRGFKNNYRLSNGKTICLCCNEKDGSDILCTLKRTKPGLNVMILRLYGFTKGEPRVYTNP
jgi:hypothetical protein